MYYYKNILRHTLTVKGVQFEPGVITKSSTRIWFPGLVSVDKTEFKPVTEPVVESDTKRTSDKDTSKLSKPKTRKSKSTSDVAKDITKEESSDGSNSNK